jgi:Protein of unknown function (DUF3119)
MKPMIYSSLVASFLLLCSSSMIPATEGFSAVAVIVPTVIGSYGTTKGGCFLLSTETTKQRQQKPSPTRLHGFLDKLFPIGEVSSAATPYDTKVTIEPDFRVAGVFLAVGAVLDTIPYIQWTLGLFTTALGILFAVQTTRIRFVFINDGNTNCLELQKRDDENNDDDDEVGENILVGGKNRWDCNAIVNYDFFPKGWIDDNPIGPILVYFRETQTPSDSWNSGPGKWANDPEKIARGESVPGQVHFFPAVCNAKQIREEFAKRGCGKLP